MINHLKQAILFVVGRRMTYRVGRALYFHARGEHSNDMWSNGEFLIQRCVLDAWLKEDAGNSRLVVFDVGANVGDWSAAFIKLLSDSKISDSVDLYAFEPVLSTMEILKRNLGDQCRYLHYEQLALSSENGDGNIFVGPGCGINSLHANPLRGDEQTVAIVRSTATEFCMRRQIQKVHLLKCDTEGHDMEVIRGALQLLVEEKVSVLQFEYNHRWINSRNFLRDVYVATEELPYVLVKLQSDYLLVLPEWNPELEKFIEGNYALIHKKSLAWFPTKKATWDQANTMVVDC